MTSSTLTFDRPWTAGRAREPSSYSLRRPFHSSSPWRYTRLSTSSLPPRARTCRYGNLLGATPRKATTALGRIRRPSAQYVTRRYLASCSDRASSSSSPPPAAALARSLRSAAICSPISLVRWNTTRPGSTSSAIRYCLPREMESPETAILTSAGTPSRFLFRSGMASLAATAGFREFSCCGTICVPAVPRYVSEVCSQTPGLGDQGLGMLGRRIPSYQAWQNTLFLWEITSIQPHYTQGLGGLYTPAGRAGRDIGNAENPAEISHLSLVYGTIWARISHGLDGSYLTWSTP